MTDLTEKLDKLVGLCKGGVSIEFNDHRNVYETVEQRVHHSMHDVNIVDDLPGDYDKMVAEDQLVELHFYPLTPIGFYHIIGYSLEPLIDEALKILESES